MEPSHCGYIYSKTLRPKAQDHCRSGVVKIVRQMNREFGVKFGLLGISEATPIKPRQHDCLDHGLTNDNINKYAILNGKKHTRP